MNGIDDIRLGQFHQLKKEIRGSEKYLIVGIHYLCHNIGTAE
jgi:hypothetical protein